MLRDRLKEPLPEYGVDIWSRMRDGLLVPNEIVQKMLQSSVVEKLRLGKKLILADGFPRSSEQARLFEAKARAPLDWCSSRVLLTYV